MGRSGGAHRLKKNQRAARRPSKTRTRLSRAFMTLVSAVTLGMTGAGYYVAHGALGGITISQALTAEDPRSSGNTMNILLIGLDSRKDQEGNDLPWSILKHLHAGDSDQGGYNTNTLILVHVGADGRVV
ncbi:MAG: LytR family transcriptional regulator, partial [Mycobacteriaceae bacterium]|nr:LytR family transcriptional regulator [Mycobacteriaceae bacterium]